MLFCCIGLMGCKDEINKIYSTKYPVRFYYEVATSTELFNALGNPGQYVTIQPLGGKIIIGNTLQQHEYPLSAIGSRDFLFGLGGLIIGTSSTLNMSNGFDLVAYDLACPNCDRAAYRLTVKDNGTASCKKCGSSFDLNNYGVILSVSDQSKEYRGLYRYRIFYNGLAINVNNR